MPDWLVSAQGWPLSLGQMDGRTIRDIGKISVNSRMSMAELMSLFRQPPLPPGAIRPLLQGTDFVPCVQCGEGVLPELYLSLACDDCESSSLAARMAKRAVLAFYQQVQVGRGVSGAAGADQSNVASELKKVCGDWHVFRHFTDVSWRLMARYVDRLGGMLHGKHLRIMTGVGLATNASAAEEESNLAQYCGHCFNVGYFKPPGMQQGVPFLLEGTAAMFAIPVNESTPRVTVNMTDAQTGEHTGEKKVMDMPTFLSALSGTLMLLTGIINCPNGGNSSADVGWPLPVEVRGWIGKTNVTPTLSSAKGTHLPFYNRIMYMGWPCTADGHGCMPVQEGQGGGVTAGCHPFDLTMPDQRAVDAALPADAVGLMTEIMEEAVPPQAPVEAVRELANRWIKCRPLEIVNREVDLKREPGVKYFRVVSMESPCAPEYLSILHEAKCRLAEETNRINAARDDGDGIVLRALLEGMDSLLCADVKDGEIKKLTVIDSMKQAMVNIAWPRKLASGNSSTSHAK